MTENRELALVLKLVADQFKSELSKSQGALGQFNSFIKDWKTQLVAAGGALFAIAKSTANFGEEALKSSQRLGLTVEKTTALQFAARMADVEMLTLERSLKVLATNAVQAARGAGEGALLFHSLGLSATDASGRIKPLDQLLFEVQDRLKGVKNQAQFVDAGVKAFGKSFLEIAPFIRQGSDATKEAMEEARKLGVVLSTEDAEAANRFNDELKKLESTMRGLTLNAGKPLVGVLTEVLELFRELGTSDAVQFVFKGLAEQVVLFSTLVKEAAANVQFLFGKLTFDQLKTEIKRLEAEGAAKLLLLENPDAAKFVNGPAAAKAGPSSGDDGGSLLPDLKKIRDDYQLYLQGLISFGREHAEALKGTGDDMVELFRLHETFADKERTVLIENAQAWLDYDEQVGASTELRLEHQLTLLERMKEKELAVHGLTADQIETIELQHLTRLAAAHEKTSEDIITGWARGMDRYVRDTKSGFGLAADLARRTAQAMEQGYRQFFFDVFDRKVKSLKDVLMGILDFVKQIASQVAAQLATKATLNAFGYGANSGGEILQRFASGGPVLGTGNRDTVPALLTPGEFVLSRQDVSAIRSGAAGGGVSVVVNNYGNNEVTTSSGRGPNGGPMIYIAVRDMVRGMIHGGEMDSPMSQRFGLSPGGR